RDVGSTLRLQGRDLERLHRLRNALQRDFAQRLGFHGIFDPAQGLLIDQDLAALGLAAKTRGQVGDAADACIFPAALEADRAERRIALRNTDAEIKIETALLPRCAQRREMLLHLERHGDRILDWFLELDRVVEED